jgi:hypothetical protein
LAGLDDDEALIHDELLNLFVDEQQQTKHKEEKEEPDFVIPTLPSGDERLHKRCVQEGRG